MGFICLFTATAAPVMVQSTSPCFYRKQKEEENDTKSYLNENNDTTDFTDHLFKTKYRRRRKKASQKLQQLSPLHVDRTLWFPFLCDVFTIKLITKSKVIFLMRGLPGSGKSTIVRSITSTYPGCVVCSADDYFMKDGVYKFDATQLSCAHSACQEKAKTACCDGVAVVVIDNTNIRRWEMNFYLELARHNDYVVVPVQPKTAWRLNPVELAKRNKHGLTEDILTRKVKQIEDVIPLFYGWFLRDTASSELIFISKCVLQQCLLQIPDLADRLLRQLSLSRKNINDWDHLWSILQEYYISPNRSGSLMHCTAKYCGRGQNLAEGAYLYHKDPRVQDSVGQAFTLVITSICYSPRTVGARVSLDDAELKLFDKPEEREWRNGRSATAAAAAAAAHLSGNKTSPKVRKTFPKKRKFHDPAVEHSLPRDYSPSLTDSEISQASGDKAFSECPLKEAKQGRSAHITLGIARGMQARETTFDVLRLCDMEVERPSTSSDFLLVTGGRLRYFGDGICCVYFSKPLYVRVLFSGYY